MADETNTSVSQQENVEQDTNNYIEAIKEMKANSVDKAAYDKLKEENKQLLDALINGGQVTQEITKEPVNIDSLRKKLFSGEAELSNLDYMKTALELREALLDQGSPDPFLPYGQNIAPTDEDIRTADRVAEAIKSCIDYADGDSEIFTNELQRITVDTSPIKRSR